jgi:hypothetical protein
VHSFGSFGDLFPISYPQKLFITSVELIINLLKTKR